MPRLHRAIRICQGDGIDVHREDEDDPLINSIGVVDVEKVFGRRKLESITDIHREGNVLMVDTTRYVLGELTNTSATYRK